MTRWWLLLIVGVALLAPSAALAQDAELPLQVPEIDTTQHPAVRVTVTAPRQLLGLEIPAEAFSLTENGEVRPVEVIRLPSHDLEVVLLIDTSGSMRGAPMEAARAAAIDFVNRMPQGVRISVVHFGSAAEVVSGFTTQRDASVAAIAGLQPRGETALYDAVGTALAQFDPETNARRAVVLLSDGGDTVSIGTREQAVASLATNDAALYVVELQTFESDPQALQDLAGATSGRVVSTEDPAALAALYEEVAAELVNRYVLAYTSEANGATALGVRLAHEGVVASASLQVTMPGLAPPPRPNQPLLRPGALFTPDWYASRTVLFVGAGLVYLALAVTIMLLLSPRKARSQLAGSAARQGYNKTGLADLADRATRLADRGLRSRGAGTALNAALERAGINLRPGEFVVLAVSIGITAAAVGVVLFNILVGLLLAGAAAIVARLAVSFLADRRQARFGDQLADTLQLLAGSLRAGYSVMQAIDAVAKEADSPTREEFRRLVVETRLGREMRDSMQAMADRLQSEDFAWVVQAISIQREVGGDLAEVLDTVAATIRERSQIRRQIKALSAEGRLSAVILFVLPFAVALAISFWNPGYLSELTASRAGYVLLVVGSGLMLLGGLWLRRIVRLVF